MKDGRELPLVDLARERWAADGRSAPLRKVV